MERRKFMKGAAGALGVAAFSGPAALATSSVPEVVTPTLQLTQVDAVLKIAAEYGFNNTDSKAGLFSFFPGTFESFEELREVAHQWHKASRDTQDRVEFIFTIKEALERAFGTNATLHYRWLRVPNDAFGGKPPIALMSTLHYFDLMRLSDALKEGRGLPTA